MKKLLLFMLVALSLSCTKDFVDNPRKLHYYVYEQHYRLWDLGLYREFQIDEGDIIAVDDDDLSFIIYSIKVNNVYKYGKSSHSSLYHTEYLIVFDVGNISFNYYYPGECFGDRLN